MAYSSSSTNRRRKTPRDFLARRVAQALLFMMSFLCLYTCPHSKVEESFNLQATHDLIYHGITPAVLMSSSSLWYNETTAKAPLPDLPYDHLSYPGVVPRTFLGPLILSWGVNIMRIPFLKLSIDLLDHPLLVQFLARALLMVATCTSWCQLARAIDSKALSQSYSNVPYSSTGTYFLLITACQFHMPFYASRMLPNVFALVVVLQAFRAWFLGEHPRAAALLVFGAAVFRCDLLLLLFTVGLSLLVSQKLSIVQALKIGIATGIASLALTVPLDSLMWQRWVWPEGEVLYYNTILGKSSDWGTSPWHWYVTKALPKMLLANLVLVPCAFCSLPETVVAWWESRQSPSIASFLDTTWCEYLLPAVGYVGLYSCLGHKEVRFLFPVIPLLNLAVAIAMTRFHKLVLPPSNKDKRVSRLARLGALGCAVLLGVSFLLSAAFVVVSQKNYPGGEALLRLEKHLDDFQTQQGLIPNEPEVRVYIDVAAAMSGISLFGQRQATLVNNSTLDWKITKAGYEDEHALKEDLFEYSASFTHIIAEADPSEGSKLSTNAFTLREIIPGKPRLDPKKGTIATEPYLYLWERIGYWQGIRS